MMDDRKICKKCGKIKDAMYFPNERLLLCDDCIDLVLPRWKNKDNLGTNIDKVNEEALAHNMSYGKYVAIEYLKVQKYRKE